MRIWGAAFATVLGLFAILASETTAAERMAQGSGSAIQATTYSTGASGSRLKWLSQRPVSTADENAVVATSYTKASAKSQPVRTAQAPTPAKRDRSFIDPFDAAKQPAEPLPAEPTEAGDSLPPVEEPQLQSSLPGLGEEESGRQSAAASAPLELPKTPTLMPKPVADTKTQPLLEREYAMRHHEFKEGCPTRDDLKKISELTTNIAPSEGDLPKDCPIGNETFQTRSFAPITFTWTASALCHKPLYFEDVQLERYGHMGGPLVQPLASAANFFLTFPILPYKMGLETPNECLYTLGYYRPGSCAPYLFDPIPLSARGALFETGAWIGGVYAFP